MKKILFFLLTIAVALFAVEWDVEQVTTGPNHYNDWPAIAVDKQGYVGIVYEQYGEVEDSLMFASNATGSWVITAVSPLMGWYSLDFDSKGNAYIAFSNNETSWDDPMDIFLAADTSGEFEIMPLVEDTGNLDVPRLKLDANDNVHFIYVHMIEESFNKLFYGWIDEADTHIELVTENLGSAWDVDFTFDQDNSPHVFYDGPEGALWHASRSSLTSNPSWTHEKIYENEWIWSMDYISAVTDAWGNFHVTCNPGEAYIAYITNKSGSWKDEIASDTLNEDLWNLYSSISVDPVGNPHIAWVVVDEGAEPMTCEIYLGSKSAEGWSREPVTATPNKPKYTDGIHFFAIDPQGYGHVTYAEWDENEEFGEIYHAKTKEPFVEAIAEQPIAANPFNLKIRGSSVYFSLQETTSLHLDLYDASGCRVQRLASGYYPAGEHQNPFNTSELSSGVYFVRIEAGRRSASVKFVLTH
jgi:hypothetical protein